MSEHADYLYALELQKQLNAANSDPSLDEDIQVVDFKPPAPTTKKPLQIKRSNPHSNLDEEFLNRTQNLVHPLWETLDPTPDVNSLFNAFDAKFFQQRLKCVTLEWSKRMYSCAGICYSSRNRHGMSITIRLSEPLLKLRPRKDLVETMLHEMIHAYCFVLNIREGNGGHGPNFKKIMYSINQVAGTNITVYHTFHDEVNVYKQHWWRCNGACQNRAPFFGYVKRTCNRAPSANDQWWAAHQEACGGTFLKIKGPTPKKPKSTAAKAKENNATTMGGPTDLRNFFPNVKKDNRPTAANTGSSSAKPASAGGYKGPTKSNGGGTMLLNPKTAKPSATAISSAFPPTSYPGLSSDPFNAAQSHTPRSGGGGGNLRNVMSFRDLNSADGGGGGGGTPGRAITQAKSPASMSGQGYALHSNRTSNSATNQTADNHSVDRNLMREVWSKRFGNDSDGNKQSNALPDNAAKGDAKRRRLSASAEAELRNADNDDDVQFIADETASAKHRDWIVLDDDIMLKEKTVDEVIALSSDDGSDGDDVGDGDGNASDDADQYQLVPRFKRTKLTADERQTVIKREILDETYDLRDEDILLIDDEYDDDNDDAANGDGDDNLNLSAAAELADTSLIDEFFSDDTLLQDFKRENDVVPSGSRYVHNPLDDIITCPVCQYKMKRSVLAEHLDGCTGIAVKILPPFPTMKKLATISREARPKGATKKRKSKKDILRDAGYSEQDLANLDLSTSTDEEEAFRSGAPTSTPATSPPNSNALNDSWQLYRQRNILKTTRQCPVCAREVEEEEMNAHLDDCLKQRRRSAARP